MVPRSASIALFVLGLAGACSSGRTTGSASSTTAVGNGPTSSTAGAVPATTAAACAPATTGAGGAGAGGGRGKEVNPPGDIPDDQKFPLYDPPGGRYTIAVPEGWARTEAPNTVTFTDKFNSVRLEFQSVLNPPTVERARAEELPKLAAEVPCFGSGQVTAVTRKVGAGVLVTYQTDAPGDPVTGKVVRQDVERYEFWRNGTEAILTLSSAAGSDNVDPWRTVTDSFAWR